MKNGSSLLISKYKYQDFIKAYIIRYLDTFSFKVI